MNKISVVIPVFRGTSTLRILAEKIMETLQEQLAEIVFVYDCGNPLSWGVIEELSYQTHKIVGVQLSRNSGQHNATICGFEYATGEFVLTMDEDLQHDPSFIPVLLEKIQSENLDIVYGKYLMRKHSGFRNITSKIIGRLLSVGIPGLHPDYTSFRIIRHEIAKNTIGMRNSYTFLDGYITWITSQVGSIEVSHSESQAGESSYTFRKLLEHSINIFVTFSTLPIRFLTYFSMIFFILSTLYSGYVIVRSFLYDDYLTGFPTMIIALGFGFGFTLLGLGILGEYIQRINLKTTNRPNYTIRKIIRNDEGNS